MSVKIINTVKSGDTGKRCTVLIEDDASICEISDIKAQIDPILDQYQFIDIDMSSVEDIDSSTIQMILSLNKYLDAKNKELGFEMMSDEVKKLMEIYDISIGSLRGTD